MLKINAIDHINMNVLSFKESEKFYKDLFGMSVLDDGQSVKKGAPYRIIGIPNRIALCLYEVEEINFDNAPIAHFGINIENYSEILNILEEKNIKVLNDGEVFWEGSASLYINDPSGHLLELTKNFAGGL